MSGRGRRSHNKGHAPTFYKARDVAASFPANSPVLEMFKMAAVKLNERQDRHERLVKLSRDITIESKRIIFQLHSHVAKEDQPKAANDALERIQKLISGPIKAIGVELENSPAYLHSRAVSPGLQEFIEARTLCHLIQNKELIPWQDVQKEFSYVLKDNEEEAERPVATLLPKVDYMLGLADLTGELMRRTINNIATGDNEESFYACNVIRLLYTGFLGVYCGGRELQRKLSVSRANTLKAEGAVYAVMVRGGEAPAALLAAGRDWDPPADHNQDDEGYY